MPDLLAVDHEPFAGVQFVPVDHDPFAAVKDGIAPQGKSIANDLTPMQPRPVSDALQSTFDRATKAAGVAGSAPADGIGPTDFVRPAPTLVGSDGTPGGNQAQNKQFRDVVKILQLTPNQAQQLHREISSQGLGFHEILQIGRDMFGK
jgi:hypothetical protein